MTKRRPRPPLDNADRAFWVAMRGAWRNWAQLLLIVEPDTVVKWHRELFRRYWTRLSRRGPGRPRVDREIRELIRRMALENDWGAPRIHGELEKLGFAVSEATVSRYLPRKDLDHRQRQRWRTCCDPEVAAERTLRREVGGADPQTASGGNEDGS